MCFQIISLFNQFIVQHRRKMENRAVMRFYFRLAQIMRQQATCSMHVEAKIRDH